MADFSASRASQYKALFEDYSQWLGTLLRDFEKTHKDEEWYKKIATLQKTLKSQSKQVPEKNSKDKKSKGKGDTQSCWIQSGELQISFTEEAQTQILFEAIEKIKVKIQEYEKFKVAVQQLSRLGLGTTITYLIYLEDDTPKKIVLKSRGGSKGEDVFKFATKFSVASFSSL